MKHREARHFCGDVVALHGDVVHWELLAAHLEPNAFCCPRRRGVEPTGRAKLAVQTVLALAPEPSNYNTPQGPSLGLVAGDRVRLDER